MKRRQILALGAAAAPAMLTAAQSRAVAHNILQGSFGSPAYDAALAARGGARAVFQSPNIEANFVRGTTREHLLPYQIKNWLNGFQFSYKMKPEDLHVVSATYASANLLTYNDAMWAKYKFGEKYKVIDPATGAPSTRNLF